MMTLSPKRNNKQRFPRVFITGLGVISPMGKDRMSHVESMKRGENHFREIDFFDVSQQRVKTAGIVDLPEPELLLGLLQSVHLSVKDVTRMDRGSQLMLYATGKAIESAGLIEFVPEGVPMVIGTSAGAMPLGEAYYRTATTEKKTYDERGEEILKYTRKGQLTRIEHYQAQKGVAMIQRAFKIRGASQIVSNACASGANAIGHAYHQLKLGKKTMALAGGYDAVSELVFSGFNALQALSLSGIPRPFDAERDGLAMGEAAAMFVLETEESMLARGASPLIEVIGYGMATDLHHLTQPHPEGKAAVASMTLACRDAGVKPSDIQYINSHGTGTPLNDVAEANAICTWCANEGEGKDASSMMVSSTKSSMGHALGGAGAIESALCVFSVQEQMVPASLNIRQIDPACRFDLVTQPRPAVLERVLTNSFGFGGCNASLIFQKI